MISIWCKHQNKQHATHKNHFSKYRVFLSAGSSDHERKLYKLTHFIIMFFPYVYQQITRIILTQTSISEPGYIHMDLTFT